MQYIPRFVRVTGGIVGAFTILLGLTISTAVAALESVPGQKIYPVKKMVESVQWQLAGEEQKTELSIRFANNRVEEMETLLRQQKEGKVSEAQVQKVVANTVRDIQKTTEAVAEKNKSEPKPEQLNKIVSLSSKQTAVIQAAQIKSDGEIKIELNKALEVSKTTTEQAIKNIERAGLVVENKPVVMEEPKKENATTAEGKITAISSTSLSIGTAQFLLTKDTEYVNIKLSDLKIDSLVKITGEINDKKSYATKIELQNKPEAKPESETQPGQPADQPASEAPTDQQ
jgi:hypothetical protein